jgi:nucleotide-binding universal stress UspA family protein
LHFAGKEDVMTSFRHILVPIDFEPSSKRALEVAIDFASKFDARLTVLHAWDMPTYVYANMPYFSGEVSSALEEAARKLLDATLADVRKRLARAEGVLVRGQAASEVLAAIEREAADLVVMGTHGRRGLNRMLIGSVAERVVRGSSVPVLTVRAGDES